MIVIEPSENSPAVARNDLEQCDACDCYGVFVFDGRKLCGDCYQTAGSCGGGEAEQNQITMP